MRGDFGLASGQKPEGGYSRMWFGEMLPPEEITFDSDVYLLLPKAAETYKASKQSVLVLEPTVGGAAAGADAAVMGGSVTGEHNGDLTEAVAGSLC